MPAANVFQPPNANLTAIAALSPSNDDIIQRKAGAWTNRTPAQLAADMGLSLATCGFRLTLESGVAVSTTDQTAKTSVYLTPYAGAPMPGLISNYESSAWVTRRFAEVSASLSGLTAGRPYDVFSYVTGGNLTLDLTAWTNTTTRATALAAQDGAYVKTGATDRLYVGTICITGTTGQCEDSGSQATSTPAKRLVWNAYNRVWRPVRIIDTTDNWTYASTTIRQTRAAAGNQVEGVFGLAGDTVFLEAMGMSVPGTVTEANRGIGVDSTSANSAFIREPWYNTTTNGGGSRGILYHQPAVGYHYFPWLEWRGTGAATITWLGDGGATSMQAGMWGGWPC